MEDLLMKKVLIVAVIAAAALISGCSTQGAPVYGPNEVVISDDGDVVVTSEKIVFEVPAAQLEGQVAGTLATASTGNVWRISQNLLRYYRQGGTMYVSGQLVVEAGVKNLAYTKIVGMRYTENNWNNWTDQNGSWSEHYSNNTDRFTIYSHSNIQPGTCVKYALYYKVSGKTYWDNNGGANYSAQF